MGVLVNSTPNSLPVITNRDSQLVRAPNDSSDAAKSAVSTTV